MSTVIAIKIGMDNSSNSLKAVLMVADRQITCGSNYSTFSKNQSKIIKKGNMLIGVVGDVRCTNIIQHQLSLPSEEVDERPIEYIIKKFVPTLRQTLKNDGYNQTINGIESQDSNMIIGYKGNIYTISYDYSVLETDEVYRVVGSGSDFAIGALDATHINYNNARDIENIIKKVGDIIEIVSRHDLYTGCGHVSELGGSSI